MFDGILIKFSASISYDERLNHIAFQGQGPNSVIIIGNNKMIVNMIGSNPFRVT